MNPERGPNPATGAERALLDLTTGANGHAHRLRVLEIEFPDCRDLFVEVSEPDSCPCRVRLALSEVTHLLLNLRESESWTIPNRDRDAAGHPHPIDAGDKRKPPGLAGG